MGIDSRKVRMDFPVLGKSISGKPIVYFDNACQSLRPKQVVDKIDQYYLEFPACGGRSGHSLGRRVDEEVKKSRKTLAKFFNARENEIIFTKNTTESINLIAYGMRWKAGDSVLISDKEHNSNLIPWQQLKEKGVRLLRFRFGDIDDFESKLDRSVRLVSFVHTSNLDGTIQPAEKMAKIAHDNKSPVLLDAAQSAPHKQLDMRKLGVDFMACSGHKMLGPSGTGLLYAKAGSMDDMRPFMTGGETVTDSTYDSATFEKIPNRYEAGLQHYAGIIGFGAAVEYLGKVGMKNVSEHEMKLNSLITEEIGSEVGLLGPMDAKERSGIFSFNVRGMNYHEVAVLLDKTANVMIRSGMHCVHSWFHANNLDGSARASLYFYNTEEECGIFVDSIRRIAKLR
ncbi:Cysteine desulfurase [uncultured archaeon]|nr:Cysteine desulfurase [uncultured archaeon]